MKARLWYFRYEKRGQIREMSAFDSKEVSGRLSVVGKSNEYTHNPIG